MIRRYIAWRNRRVTDPRLREVIKRASTIKRAKAAWRGTSRRPAGAVGALRQRALGAPLLALRDEGVLVIGSGYMTHSFAVLRDPEAVNHNRAFDEWAADALGRGDVDALMDYQAKGPGAAVAHPTADHFVPLLLTLGAATDPATVSTAIDRFVIGNSTRSIQVA
jgi:aromatic ring-opening dioxygenase catalytic subunit (LigB family)